MANGVLTTADLARMLRQIIDSEENEAVVSQDPRFAYTDVYRVPWRGTEIQYCIGMERGVVNCPVCGVMGGMGYLSFSGNGAEFELRYEDLHVLEVHAGRVGGELVLDIERLRQVLGVADLPLVDRVDKRLQDVLMALWEIQSAVISQYYQYSRDMHQKRRQGYLTTWKGRTIRVWFSTAGGPSRPCPLCGVDDWKSTLDTSLGEGNNRVDIPAAARHLMEVHGLAEIPDWQVWDRPGDYEKVQTFFGISD
jgi:hypothetical protein